MYVVDVNLDDQNAATSAAFFVPVWSAGNLVQKQANWNETNTSKETYIKNKPEIPVVPTKISAFENDKGYLTEHQDISTKADKATSLLGYGITDAYTKTEVDSMVGSIESILSEV